MEDETYIIDLDTVIKSYAVSPKYSEATYTTPNVIKKFYDFRNTYLKSKLDSKIKTVKIPSFKKQTAAIQTNLPLIFNEMKMN